MRGIRTLPIWVKLPQFPLSLWVAKSPGKIGSVLGNPLFTYECTTNKLRVSYACILVDINIMKKTKELITIKNYDDKRIEKLIEYEWKPKFCETCQHIGQPV